MRCGCGTSVERTEGAHYDLGLLSGKWFFEENIKLEGVN